MKKKSKKMFLYGAAGFAVVVTLIWPMLPMVGGEDRLSSIPMSGPDFESREVKLKEHEIRFLDGAQAIQRIIKPRGGSKLSMSVIDGSGNRHAVHDPSYCFAGGGWKMVQQREVALSSGKALLMSLSKEGQMMEAMWFFDDGHQQFTSSVTYWLRASLRRATRGWSGPRSWSCFEQSRVSRWIGKDSVK
ncbi:MAG: exosortase-associated EpsI family protein [Verrucomicrobia bacterium]|nr:MAG: exosortase-associated EpsI family protein [Verrucomicrobiota bacterium]